jgi:MYXO-CTERM domain-containing protein
VRGLKQFAAFNGLWANYQTWMENNANAAWKERNSINITWDNWLAQTPEPGNSSSLARLPTSSAAAIWQLLPQSSNPALVGTFELKNVQSNLSITVQSEADAADESPVTQDSFAGTNTSLWRFVFTAGAYYRIQNVATGLFLSVEGNSAQGGAKVVASPAAPHAQGNDQWLPLLNADGSYSFFNLSTILALDVPAASMTAGTQLDQGFGNGMAQQSFTLIAQPASGDAGAGAGAGAEASASENDDGGIDSNGGESDGGLGPVKAESDADALAASGSGGGATSSGCGCKTAGASPTPTFAGGLAFLALGSLGAFRRRRKSATTDGAAAVPRAAPSGH